MNEPKKETPKPTAYSLVGLDGGANDGLVFVRDNAGARMVAMCTQREDAESVLIALSLLAGVQENPDGNVNRLTQIVRELFALVGPEPVDMPLEEQARLNELRGLFIQLEAHLSSDPEPEVKP